MSLDVLATEPLLPAARRPQEQVGNALDAAEKNLRSAGSDATDAAKRVGRYVGSVFIDLKEQVGISGAAASLGRRTELHTCVTDGQQAPLPLSSTTAGTRASCTAAYRYRAVCPVELFC